LRTEEDHIDAARRGETLELAPQIVERTRVARALAPGQEHRDVEIAVRSFLSSRDGAEYPRRSDACMSRDHTTNLGQGCGIHRWIVRAARSDPQERTRTPARVSRDPLARWRARGTRSTTRSPMLSPDRERSVLLTLAAVQFVNILDFMMVMPLGPDFARSLHIDLSDLPILAASYTGSACVGGIIASIILDRFDRRRALVVTLLGLAVGTLAGGLATDLTTLALTRVFAGFFGGPATSIALAIVADVVPAERRGRALGTVMTAFSIASVLGVPAGLELATLGGWHTPFFCVGAMGLIAAFAASRILPPLRAHLDTPGEHAGESALKGAARILSRRRSILSFSMSVVSNAGLFIVIPNIAAFVQSNLDFPRDRLSTLYILGGAASVITTRPFGRLVDRFGSFRVGLAGTILGTIVTYFFFAVGTPDSPIYLLFVAFMLSGGLRNVAASTLISKVPEPAERARFMAMDSTLRHGALALGAGISSLFLIEQEGMLVGMHAAALTSIAIVALVPFFVFALEREVTQKNQDDAKVAGAPRAA